jgi:hypothetical protein
LSLIQKIYEELVYSFFFLNLFVTKNAIILLINVIIKTFIIIITYTITISTTTTDAIIMVVLLDFNDSVPFCWYSMDRLLVMNDYNGYKPGEFRNNLSAILEVVIGKLSIHAKYGHILIIKRYTPISAYSLFPCQ